MKHSAHKKLIAGLGLGLGAILLSGCTANFCSEIDQAAMAYPFDQGVTVYCTEEEYNTWKAANPEAYQRENAWSNQAEALGMPRIEGLALEGNALVYKYVPIAPATITKTIEATESTEAKTETTYDWDSISFTAAKYNGSALQTAIQNAQKTGFHIPSVYYFGLLDDYVLKAAIAASYGKIGYASSSDYAAYYTDPTDTGFKSLTCTLPEYTWENNGYSEDELRHWKEYVQNNAHII